jgi:demethylmenaquinone methyltransferase/2-methoxy-6-polyprenyl-1,4-benzoquinol methylase
MRAMFSTIAPRYDFITRMFSYGMDKHWKRLGVKRTRLPPNPVVLDLASGTGDFSFLVSRQYPGARPVAVDLTERMLQFARQRGVESAVCGDAGSLPFPDASFDCVFVGYGLRNFPNLAGALREIERVTRPGGLLVSLDFFLPANAFLRTVYLA